MKFIIDRNELTNAVQDVIKAISSRAVIPILSGIKIEAKQDGIYLTGSNSDISIERFIPLEDEEHTYITMFETGSIVLQARFFAEIVRKLPLETVEISVDNELVATIKSGRSEFSLNGLSAEEYPRLPKLDDHRFFEIEAQALKTVIRQTVFAVSVSETRPALTGVNWQYEDHKLQCVATDSHRLALRHIKIEKSSDQLRFSNVIVPGKSLNELAKIIEEQSDPVQVVVTEHYILFKAKHVLFYSRLLEGNYPEVSKLIPTDSTTSIVVETKPFLHAMERASLLARENNNNVVKLTGNADLKLEISSFSPEVGKIVEEIDAETYEGEELTISFNAKYMLDALRAIDSETIIIDFNGSMRPFLLRPIDDSSMLQLILPIRTY